MIFHEKGDDVVIGERADWLSFEAIEDPLQIICEKRWFEGSDSAKVFELQLFKSKETGQHYKKVYRIRYRSDKPVAFGGDDEEDEGGLRLFEEKKIEQISQEEAKVLQKKHFGGRIRVEDQPDNQREAQEILNSKYEGNE